MTPKLLLFEGTHKTDQFGQIFLTDTIDVSQYNRVSFEIEPEVGSNNTMQVEILHGKLSGWTLGQAMVTFSMTDPIRIRSFEVIAPEISVFLTGGTPNTDVSLQAWLFLK